MSINRFNTPQEAQHIQPYISQYVAAPFDAFAAQNQAKQKVWDTSESDMRDILSNSTDAIAFERKLKDAYLKKNYITPIEELVETSGGDMGEIASKVATMKSKLASDQGLAQFAQNLKLKQDLDAKIRASPMNAIAKENALRQYDYDFQKSGGSLAGADYEGASIYDTEYAAKKAAEVADKVKPRIISEEFSGFTNGEIDPSGNFIGYDDRGRKTTINAAGIIADRVYNVLATDPTVTGNVQRSIADTYYQFIEANPTATRDDFNNYVVKETKAQLRNLANSYGNLLQQNDVDTKNKKSIHTLPRDPRTGALVKPQTPMEIGTGAEIKYDTETPFTEKANKIENTGSGIQSSMYDILYDVNKNKTDATPTIIRGTANAVARLALNKGVNEPISQHEWNIFNKKLADNDPYVMRKLREAQSNGVKRFPGGTIATLQEAAKILEEDKKAITFQKSLYKDQALSYLTPYEKVKYKANDPEITSKVDAKINEIHNADNQERGVFNEVNSPIIGGRETADKTIVGGVNVGEVIVNDNSGIINKLFSAVPEGQNASLYTLMGLDVEGATDAQVQEQMKKLILSGTTVNQTPLNKEGTKYKMNITSPGGATSYSLNIDIGGSGPLKPNELRIGTDAGSDQKTRGAVNYIKKQAFMKGADTLPGTNLYLSTKGGVTNSKTGYSIYKRRPDGTNEVYTQGVDQFLNAYANATTDEERKAVEKAYTNKYDINK